MVFSISLLCELILLILVFLIIFPILLSSNQLFSNIDIVTDIMDGWRQKPIDSLQASKFRSCEELRQTNLVNYYWPGNIEGCVCNEELKVTCSAEDLKNCEKISSKEEANLQKWKGYFICGSYIKSQTYFELSKTDSDKCLSRYKDCGLIDTLNNRLCVPQNEQCPINNVIIRKGTDENNFELQANNYGKDGRIFYAMNIAEGTEPCVNPNNRVFSSYSNKRLYKIVKSENKESAFSSKPKISSYSCYNTIYHETKGKLSTDVSNIIHIDSTSLPDFYRVNNIDAYKLSDLSKMSLFLKTYRGWKKSCETKAFLNFYNSNPKDEINQIEDEMKQSSQILQFAAIGMIFGCILSLLNKHKGVMKEHLVMVFLFFHMMILVCSAVIFIISYNIGSKIKNCSISIEFFELVIKKSCSDADTDSILSSVAKDFFELNDRFFNFKIMTIIVALLTISLYVLPLKNKYEKIRRKLKLDHYSKSA